MSSRSLSDQPSEILDHICAFVGRPKDILAFALTSRQVYRQAIPDHIEFRHLRCDIRRISLWRKLSELPAIASRFSSLEIVVEDGTDYGYAILPIRSKLLADRNETEDILFDWNPKYSSLTNTDGSNSDDSDESNWRVYEREQTTQRAAVAKCIQTFVGALQCMSGLTRFHWLVAKAEPSSACCTALLRCPALKDVDIFPKDIWRPEDGVVNTDAYGPWELSNLCQFSMDFSDEFSLDITQQYTTRMIKMLDRCPKLEDLHLFPWHPTYLDSTQVLAHGRWPSLKRFTLRRMGDVDPQDDGALRTFIRAHSQLERLYIDTDDHEALNAKRVWSESLPHLRALHAGRNWDMRQILTPNTTRNLEFLSVVDLSPNSQDESLSILAHIPSLRSLVVHCPSPSPEFLSRFAEAAPWIEKLQFRFGTYQSRLTAALIKTDKDEIFSGRLRFISQLSHLTHLGLLIDMDEELDAAYDVALINAAIQRVANASETVRYMRLARSLAWMTIERNEDGSYKDWRLTKKQENVSEDHWGGFFIGAPRRAYLNF